MPHNASAAERSIREYLESYLYTVARIRDLDTLRERLSPSASLGEGMAGTAYALWRLGEPRLARRWADAARQDSGRRAFHTRLAPATRRTSTMFGQAGVRWVAAMVGGGPHTRAYAHSLGDGCTRLEFASGTAGQLLTGLLLVRERPDQAIRRLLARNADRLDRALRRRSRTPWTPRDATGFAHGWPGVLFALLAWHRAAGSSPSPDSIDALSRLARLWSPYTIETPALRASWCNGAAGATLLWVAAFESTGDPVFLRLARRTARAAVAASGHASTLCCGDTGVAFALLAMARIDPGAAWRDPASALCARAIGQAVMPHPFGLFHGHAGLACLAHDCLAGAGGFPALER